MGKNVPHRAKTRAEGLIFKIKITTFVATNQSLRITMKMKSTGMLMVLTVLLWSMALSSCVNDEPDLLVGYYLEVQSSDSFMAASEDEEQGTMSDHTEGNVLYTTITGMKRALRQAYPTPDYEGNDAAVIAAIDDIYHRYKANYGHLERNTICVAKLYRTRMDGTLIKYSRSLKNYRFGALPPKTE